MRSEGSRPVGVSLGLCEALRFRLRQIEAASNRGSLVNVLIGR